MTARQAMAMHAIQIGFIRYGNNPAWAGHKRQNDPMGYIESVTRESGWTIRQDGPGLRATRVICE